MMPSYHEIREYLMWWKNRYAQRALCPADKTDIAFVIGLFREDNEEPSVPREYAGHAMKPTDCGTEDVANYLKAFMDGLSIQREICGPTINAYAGRRVLALTKPLHDRMVRSVARVIILLVGKHRGMYRGVRRDLKPWTGPPSQENDNFPYRRTA